MSETRDFEPFTLSPQALATAERIRRLAGLDTIEEAISRSLGDELFFQEKLDDGWSIVLSRDGYFWELDWKK